MVRGAQHKPFPTLSLTKLFRSPAPDVMLHSPNPKPASQPHLFVRQSHLLWEVRSYELIAHATETGNDLRAARWRPSPTSSSPNHVLLAVCIYQNAPAPRVSSRLPRGPQTKDKQDLEENPNQIKHGLCAGTMCRNPSCRASPVSPIGTPPPHGGCRGITQAPRSLPGILHILIVSKTRSLQPPCTRNCRASRAHS